MKTLRSFAFALFLSVPASLFAADPFTGYATFFPSDRTDPAMLRECMTELAIDETESPVAAQLFLIRRCINTKKAAAKPLRRPEAVSREQAKYRRVSQQAKSLTEAKQTSRLRSLMNRDIDARKIGRRTNVEGIKSAVLQDRASRRSLIQGAEKARSEEVLSKERREQEAENACGGLPVAEKKACILKQLHNTNLFDNE